MVNYVLKYSLERQVPIDIIYQKDMEITQRKVQIKKIEGNIVYAYCYHRKALRNFRMENILSASFTKIRYNHDKHNNCDIVITNAYQDNPLERFLI